MITMESKEKAIRKGSLKWFEVIYRDVEREDLTDVINELVDAKVDGADIVIESDIDDTFSVSYRTISEPWKDLDESVAQTLKECKERVFQKMAEGSK